MAVGTSSKGASGETETTSTQETTVVESTAASVGHISEGKPLILLQVNCRSICNKALEFWN
jgi:hypothetical protein